MDEAQLYRRLRTLPEAIDRTEKKLARLYAEAREYRMADVIDSRALLNEAWEREIRIAQLEAAARGHENSMGVDGI